MAQVAPAAAAAVPTAAAPSPAKPGAMPAALGTATPGAATAGTAAPGAATAGTAAAGAAVPAAKSPEAKKRSGDALLRAVVEPYVDDTDLYVPKISRKARYRYWEAMMKQKTRRVPPRNFFGYLDAITAGNPENNKFPTALRLAFKIITSSFWDYLYLGLFLLFIIAVVAFYDGLAVRFNVIPALPPPPVNATIIVFQITTAPTPSPTFSNSTAPTPGPTFAPTIDPAIASMAAANAAGITSTMILVPLILMFVAQLIPTFGVIYFVCRANDMSKFLSAGKMGNWAFTAALTAQIVEYRYFGGADRVSAAGTARIVTEESKAKEANKNATLAAAAAATGGSKLFGSKKSAKTHAAADEEDQKADADPYASDDSELGHAFDEDSSDEEIAVRIDKAYAQACREAEEKGEEPPARPEEEVSAFEALRRKRAAEAKAKADELEANRIASEAACRDWTEWTCLVCNKQNRRPTHPVRDIDVRFGIKGAYYKRLYAIIRQSRDAPQCLHCLTHSDYQPPMSSAHTFKHNKKPFVAFQNYPFITPVQSGLSNKWYDRYANYIYSFFFGIRDNSSSKLVFNDWRLRVYVNGVFPEMPRQVKPKDEIFNVGEMVECRLQKSDWSRCHIIAARDNHTYDIRYDAGDELRLLLEENLRLPPEKRSYAYLVEAMMVLLVLLFPICIAAAFVVMPGAVFAGPFIVGLVLFSTRVYRTVGLIRTYHYAGICPIFRLAVFFTLPLLLVLLAGALPLVGGSWTSTAVFMIAAKMTSCPVMYVQKPNIAVFAFYLFLQSSASLYLLGSYFDGHRIFPTSPISIALAPLFTATLTAIYYRANLHTVWDVQLYIRPPCNFIPDKRTLKEKIEDMIGFTLW